MRALSFTLGLGVVAALVVVQPAVAATAVCAVYCDTRDPSLASQDLFPVPEKTINGRRIVLHVSNTDSMAWGSIDNGAPGDGVWLDRSRDGGATWDGLLGKATIPSTWTGTRMLMYNISDPSHHRRGVIRTCGDGQGIVCTNWVYPACDDIHPEWVRVGLRGSAGRVDFFGSGACLMLLLTDWSHALAGMDSLPVDCAGSGNQAWQLPA